jgi:3-hydroxyacyl-[acyl-carrier-protein] dehydratase
VTGTPPAAEFLDKILGIDRRTRELSVEPAPRRYTVPLMIRKDVLRMPPVALVDPSTIDTSRVLADREGIYRHNPQRFEMEQLTAIVLIDQKHKLIIGYKDVAADEFWVRGHMPDYPLLPGVLMCEAAAQLASYYCKATGLLEVGFVGFGGMEEVRFRGQVRPGDRLVLVGKGIRLHRRQSIFEVQGFVESNMVFHGKVIGVMIAGASESPG